MTVTEEMVDVAARIAFPLNSMANPGNERIRARVRDALTAAIALMRGQSWRCFHCDEVFTDEESATAHFGTHERHDPACTIDAAEYRRMEKLAERFAEEDADCHRAMYRMQGEHQQALRRAEEAGYAKGVRDTENEAKGHSR